MKLAITAVIESRTVNHRPEARNRQLSSKGEKSKSMVVSRMIVRSVREEPAACYGRPAALSHLFDHLRFFSYELLLHPVANSIQPSEELGLVLVDGRTDVSPHLLAVLAIVAFRERLQPLDLFIEC